MRNVSSADANTGIAPCSLATAYIAASRRVPPWRRCCRFRLACWALASRSTAQQGRDLSGAVCGCQDHPDRLSRSRGCGSGDGKSSSLAATVPRSREPPDEHSHHPLHRSVVVSVGGAWLSHSPQGPRHRSPSRSSRVRRSQRWRLCRGAGSASAPAPPSICRCMARAFEVAAPSTLSRKGLRSGSIGVDAGPQGSFLGLDQVDVLLPPSLRGSGPAQRSTEWSSLLLTSTSSHATLSNSHR